jgi:hypothetical protein
MAIDPAVLHVQRRAVTAPSPSLRLVKCDCGTCRACWKRGWMQRARSAGRYRAPSKGGHKGVAVDPSRCCTVCAGPVAVSNQSGVCNKCQRRVVRVPVWFRDGGGI